MWTGSFRLSLEMFPIELDSCLILVLLEIRLQSKGIVYSHYSSYRSIKQFDLLL